MSQSSSDKYLHFTVGLLKDSAALDALRQDAIKHHMVDQPGQLIALRLTEYYEMMNRGIVQPVIRVPAIAIPIEAEHGANGGEKAEKTERATLTNARMPATTGAVLPPTSRPVNTPRPPEEPAASSQMTGKMRAVRKEEQVMYLSNAADQNADEAADYWSTL